MKILVWAVRIVAALMFLIPAAFQVSGDAQWNDEFTRLGLGQAGLYAVAVVETIASLLVLVPHTTFLGLFALLAVTAGAFVAQVTVIGNIIHTFVYFGVLSAMIAFLRHRGRLQATE